MTKLNRQQIIALSQRGHSPDAIVDMVGVSLVDVVAHLKARGYLPRTYGYSRNRCVGGAS